MSAAHGHQNQDLNCGTLACHGKIIIDNKCNLMIHNLKVTGDIKLSSPLPQSQGGTGTTFGPVTSVPIQYQLYDYTNPQYRLVLPGSLLGVDIYNCSLSELIIPPSDLLTQLRLGETGLATPVFTLNQEFLNSFPSLQALNIFRTSVTIPNNFGELDYNLVNDLQLDLLTPGPTTTGNFVFPNNFNIVLSLPGVTSYGTFNASASLSMQLFGDLVTPCSIGSISSTNSSSTLEAYLFNLGPNSSIGNVFSAGNCEFDLIIEDGMTMGNFDLFGNSSISFGFNDNGESGTTPVNVGYIDAHNNQLNFWLFSTQPENDYPIHFGDIRNSNTGYIQINPPVIGQQPGGGGIISIGNITNCVNIGLVIINVPTLTTIGSLIGTTVVNTPLRPAGILLYNNGLNVATVSQILIDLDANGQTDFLINLTGGTNAGFGALTVGGATAHANLLSKGWTIEMNP